MDASDDEGRARRPTSFSFQWSRCDAAGEACTDIAGASAATYTVTAEDVGSTPKVTVSARNRISSLDVRSAAGTPVP